MALVKTPGSRLHAIRAKCIDCAGGKYEAGKCTVTDCALFPYHTGHRPKDGGPHRTPQNAIREHCKWCCGVDFNGKFGAYWEAWDCIYNCTCTDCGIWPYRPRKDGQSEGRGGESCGDLPEEEE